jgi:hypothetical protein
MIDPDCLDRNDDLITAVVAAQAAGRVDDAFKYLECLHKDIVHIATLIDRADERKVCFEILKRYMKERQITNIYIPYYIGAMLEGLKVIGGVKRKRLVPATSLPMGLSIPLPIHVPIIPMIKNPTVVAPAPLPRRDSIPSLGSSIPRLVSTTRILPPPSFKSPSIKESEGKEILAVCVDCRDRKKSKRYCREVNNSKST